MIGVNRFSLYSDLGSRPSKRSELDTHEQLQQGVANGTMRAAKRKMHQELGLTPVAAQSLQMSFAGRVRYRAADVHDSSLGEAELDHILVAMLPQSHIDSLVHNTEEMSACWLESWSDFCTRAKSDKGMMAPWLRLMHEHGLIDSWWNQLHKMTDRGGAKLMEPMKEATAGVLELTPDEP